MKNTTVEAPASKSQRTRAPSRPSWPVTNVTSGPHSRCVSGIPAYAGTASPAETPGTTSNATPAAASAAASSPPRPNMNGSPPLRRVTTCPMRPRDTRIALISSCGREWWPSRLPA